MKRIFYFSTLLAASALIISCHGSSAAASVEKSFKVWGNCDKCKAQIEKAGDLPGVSSIHWSEETNQLGFKIDTTVTTPDAVLNAVAEAGYDNERYTANAEAYDHLPKCCHYDRKTMQQ